MKKEKDNIVEEKNEKLEIENETEKNIKKEKKKENSKSFTTSETILLVIIGLIIGLSLGNLILRPSSNKLVSNDKDLNDFIESYQYILNNYYESIDKSTLIKNAISGMMNSLDDPYSVYMDEDESNSFSTTLDGSYKGIGIEITKDEDNKYVLVTTVFKDTPAEKSGIKVGDKIISIDDKNSSELELSEFSSIIRNSDKNSFELKILRNEEELTLTLNKETVVLDSVTSKVYEENGKKIGYIYIGIFANNTYEQFKTELTKLENENISYLIIDVRSNTGGHLTAVDSILDLFLNSKQIMYEFDQDGKITPVYATGNENKNYEIILLGDSISASASEVLIAGLKENLNSIFIGEKTYGKGTVQKLVTLSDGTQYKLTVKKWLTPKGNWVNDNKGISPDIEISLDSKYYETGEDSDDNQLQRALEYIRNK